MMSEKKSDLSLEELYTSGELDAAREALIKQKSLYGEGQYHYNLGTLSLKAGDYATARYHLEKAISEGYANSSAYKNLAVAKQKLAIKDIDGSHDLYEKTLNSVVGVPTELFICLTLTLVLSVLMAHRKSFITRSWQLALALFIAFTPIVIKNAVLGDVKYGVVLKETTTREGPSAVYDETSSLFAGTKVILGKESADWFFIKHPYSLAGWVKKSDLGVF